MPTLVLIRHAQAGHGFRDFDRPLTRAGRGQADRLGAALVSRIGSADIAVHSAARRTAQTFERVRARLAVGEHWADKGLYYADTEDAVALARAFDPGAASALIVGHEPTMSATGHYLARKGDRDLIGWGIPTATAIVLAFDGPWEGLGEAGCRVRDVLLNDPAL